MAESALRYVLSQDVATVIPGLRSVGEVDIAAKTGNNYTRLTVEEQRRFKVSLKDYCRDCGACLPCPQKINIPAVLRFHTLHKAYDLGDWAKKLYSGLADKADKCNACGQCEPKCPYKLPIQNKLKKTHQDLKYP